MPDLAFFTDKPCVAAIKAVSSLTEQAAHHTGSPNPRHLPSTDKLTGSCQRNSEISEVSHVFIMSVHSLTQSKKLWTATDFILNIETIN